jgi:serine/threonine protein kinase
MGVVYEAVDDTIERRVAIKVLTAQHAKNPDITVRFFNEARAANRIDHPSIVRIFEYNQLPDGDAYLVMELLNGESLASRLRRESQLPAHIVAHIGWQIAAGLAAAHKNRIVHRDLKPANVMLVADPIAPGGERVKLLDFGIAKLTEGTKNPTKSNVIMGTPTYMSPEQCKGAGGVDERSDVYSLGVVLFEMLAGRPPFISDGAGEIIGMHLFAPLPDLAQLSPQSSGPLIALVASLLAKDRKLRPAMADVATVLAELRTDRSSAPTLIQPPAGVPFPTAGHYRRGPLVAALLGIVGLGGLYLTETHRRTSYSRPLQTEPAAPTPARPVPSAPPDVGLSMAEAVRQRETLKDAPVLRQSTPLQPAPQPSLHAPRVAAVEDKSLPTPRLTPEQNPTVKKSARLLPKEPGTLLVAHRVVTSKQQRPAKAIPEERKEADAILDILETKSNHTTSVRVPDSTGSTTAQVSPAASSSTKPVESQQPAPSRMFQPARIKLVPKDPFRPTPDQ